MVRLNRSQMSIILTKEVFGRELDTLINLMEGMVQVHKVHTLTSGNKNTLT